MGNRDDKQLNRHLGKPLSLQFPGVHCSTTHLPTHKPASLPFPYHGHTLHLLTANPSGEVMDSSGDWVRRWCFLASASYFLLFSFSLPFCSPPTQVLHKLQLLLGIPVLVWAIHGMTHLLWQRSLPCASSSCNCLRIPSSLILTSPPLSSLFSPHISPHDPWRGWDSSDWPLSNWGKVSIKGHAGAGRRFALQLPKQLVYFHRASHHSRTLYQYKMPC